MDPQPATACALAETDVRRIVRLLGEVISSPGDIHEKRRLLMDGLCHIINATAWVWSMAEIHPDDKPPPPPLGLPRQMDPERLLDRSAASPLWIKNDIDPLIMSLRPAEGGGVNAIRIYRTLEEPRFTARETQIAHIVLSEIPWLHFNAFPNQAARGTHRLYPRHHTVLSLLGDGWSRKKIASHLGISLNTVHGYTKALFKHFGVHSQSELLARFPKALAGADEIHSSGGS